MSPAAPVTVVVATRNRCDRLRACLSALAALPEQPEVIVVDNASTDGTAALVRLRHPGVRLVRLPRNAGAVARNVGVRLARTEVVAFADDDSAWRPGALARAAGLMAEHPRLGLIAAHTLVGPDAQDDPMSRFMASAPLGPAGDLPGPPVLGFLACAAVVRRSAFLATGGFDPVVFFMGEEARVAYDLARLGWALCYCPDVVAHHLPGGSGPDPVKVGLQRRNRALTSWMCRPVTTAVADTLQATAAGGVWGLARRLPAALARRRLPVPRVEAQLRRLRDAPLPS